jgi:SOS-response transcriptional repressor LexA
MNTLKQLMDQRGLSATALAKKVGCTQPEIWRLAKYPERGGRKMTAEWAARLAPHLDVPPEALLFSDNLDVVRDLDGVRPVHVRGETAAGRWFEQEEIFDEEPPMISMVLGKYQTLRQFAFRVVGNSMNKKRIHNGDYVVCVPYFEARSMIMDGDIVVVERRRGHLTERTVKQVQHSMKGWELWPRSTDPAHQEPIFIEFNGNMHGEDGTEIEIVGLVISSQTPIG